MSEKICYIVGAGENPGLDFTPSFEDIVIAADGGYEYLKQAGLLADIVIGDFDSLKDAPGGDNIISLPPEKDDTDMYCAVKEALKRKYRSFIIYGGTGGRLSHTLANIQLLNYLARNGCRGYLIGQKEVLTVIYNGGLEFDSGAEGYISVFAIGGTALGVTLKGLKYPLTDYDMTCLYPIGISNEFTGRTARVEVSDGALLIIFGRVRGLEPVRSPFDL